nr:cmp-sialic acid transporter 2 [Quercus suber]
MSRTRRALAVIVFGTARCFLVLFAGARFLRHAPSPSLTPSRNEFDLSGLISVNSTPSTNPTPPPRLRCRRLGLWFWDEDGNGGGDDIESRKPLSVTNVATLGGATVDWSKWKLKIVVVVALTLLTSSQGILTVWSKRNGKYDYSVTTSNFMVEALKCLLSLLALARIWKSVGVTEDNRLSTTLDEVIVYPIPALLYLVKNMLQDYILEHVDAPGYQILKNLNIISTGVLYRIILKKKLSNIQWAAFILLCVGCSTTQLKTNSDDVLQTPVEGWLMAIVMALLSSFAGVYTEAIMKKRPSRNINV